MPILKLTIQSVQSAKGDPERPERDLLYRDSDVKGFSLKVTPSGSKIFLYQYRIGGRAGVTRRITIGKFPTVKPDEARRIAQSYAFEVAKKIDPIERIKAEAYSSTKSKQLTFGSLIEPYSNEKLRGNRSKDADTSIFRRVFIPEWENRPISSIDRQEIKSVVTKAANERGGYAGNKALSVIKPFFQWAYDEEYIKANVAARIEKPFSDEESRKRVLTSKELKQLWHSFDKLECKPFSSALKLLLMLGQRRNEVGKMKWEDIDFDFGLWIIPHGDAKNKKEHAVPLLPEALALIAAQPKLILVNKDKSKRVRSKFVFTTTGKTPISGWSKTKEHIEAVLAAKKIVIADWRLHDFRRTMSTTLGDSGYEDHEIGILLNHSRRGVTAIYNRSKYLDKKINMMQVWQKYLTKVLAT